MTAKLIVSNAARSDTRDILDYLRAEASERIALHYALAFNAAIDRIAELPHSGSPRRQYGAHVRVIVIDRYLVFYETDADGREVRLLRILHGARDIDEDLISKGRG